MSLPRTSADPTLSDLELKELNRKNYVNADRLSELILMMMFLFGIFISSFYNTWLVAFCVGGLCLIAYYATKKILPGTTLYQYVLSGVFALFSAQFIYQMHGMAEMHFWVFIGATVLIIYQNWRLQIPLIVIVIIHHGTFAYLQYIGYKEVYFTQLAYMDLVAFIFHGVLASCVCLIAGVWSHTIHQRTVQDALNFKMLSLLKEELLETNQEIQSKNEELRTSEEELLASAEELKQINENLNGLVEHRTNAIIHQNNKLLHHAFLNAHKVRSPLARILGLTNLINLELKPEGHEKEILDRLTHSANELDEVLQEVRINLDEAEFKGLENNGASDSEAHAE